MMTARERYQNDPAFRTLVDALYCAIERAEYTPTEIREAAMMAQMRYEDCHIRPIIMRDGAIEPRPAGSR